MRAALVWLNQVYVLILKELKQLYKDRALFAFTVFIFTLDIMMAAGSGSMELRQSPLALHDADRTPASRELAERFQPPYFLQLPPLADLRQGVPLLDRGGARAVLAIPEHFAADLAKGRQAQVQLLIDTSQANQGYLVSSYAQRIAADFSAEQAQRNLRQAGAEPGRLPQIRVEARYWNNSALNEVWFNTISEMLTMITVAAVLLPGAAMVREKERGTIEQLLVSPVAPVQVVLGKVTAMMLVMLLGTAVAVLGVMHGLYDVPVRGNHALFFLVVALYAVASAGLGIVASTFARNSGQMGLIVLLIIIPMVNLSGTWNMTETMPAWLQALVELSPLRHFILLVYGILIRGADLDVLWPPLAKMLALGGVLFAVGVWRFRRQFR